MKRSLEILVYDTDVASNNVVDNLTGMIQGLSFSTKLHGGFNLCSFKLREDWARGWEWITKRMFHRITIRDTTKLIWEGRIQDIGLSIGAIEITAYGYYASLNDGTYNTSYNANADVVIKAILTAQCPQINSDQSNIQATGGPAITSAADTSYLDKHPRELMELLAGFGDTSGNAWYFAIWDDRKPYFFPRSTSTADWYIRLKNLSTFKLKHGGGNLWNKVYAIYDAAGLTRTADAQDVTSQTKYGITRYYPIPNLGTVAAAAAEAIRDTWLADHKNIWPSLENIIVGDFAEDGNGVQYPSSYIRAGDVIVVRDLQPVSGDLKTLSRDALRTFFIMETNYDAETGTNRLTLDTESQSIDAIIARMPKYIPI